MASTYFQWTPNVVSKYAVGESSGTKYDIEVGQPVYIGVDDDSNASRVIPVTDISAHEATGLAMTATADTSYDKDKMSVALFPVRILTNNVDSTDPPEAVADNRVYILDDGSFSDADGGSAGHSYGSCIEVITSGAYSGFYEINIPSRDET